MTKKIKVGIIGFGMAGRVFHAPIINSTKELELSKIVSSRKETFETVKKLYPQVEVVSDIDELLRDDTIDLVVITAPNTYHVELAEKALLANKHVVVEKPFTITSKEADKLIELSKKQKRVLTVNQNRRWDSDFLTVKKIIEDGLLGRIVEYEAHFDRFRNYFKNNWREEKIPGSGILYDLGSHLIDQAQCLFGLPKEIMADIRIQRKGGVTDDSFEVILHYEKIKVTLKAGMLVREPLPRFIVLGDKGSFVKYGLDVQEAALKKGKFPNNVQNWGEEPEELWGVLNTNIKGLHFRGKVESLRGDYRKFYENVYKTILGEEELKVKPEEARNTIRIIELAMESSNQKRTVKFS
jgi:predicted dehydrogenase